MALHGSAGFAEELPLPEIIELNVGGQVYITRSSTLTSVPDSLLFEMFSQKSIGGLARDTKGRFFLDRDGFLFRYILDYMRDQQLVLPDHFPERGRLKREAEFFHLPELVKMLAPKVCKQNSLADECCQSDPEESSPSVDFTRNFTSTASCSGLVSGLSDARGSGFITVGYRGSYTLGRDSQTDAKFRRVARIMVCGKTSLAKEVFGETLNESRDPDRPLERYTSRYYLKFTFLEQAFDRLSDAGFHMVACNSTGTCAFAHEQTDDKIWTNYTEYIFYRDKAPASPHISDSGTLYNPHMSINCSQEDTSNVFDLDNVSLPDFPPPLSLTLPLLENPELPGPGPGPGPLSHNSMSLSRPTTLPLKNISRPPGSNSLATTTPVIARQNDGPRRKEPEEEEKKLIEEELKKCIDDFRKIRIPKLFPDRKRHWQSDLLRKYNA